MQIKKSGSLAAAVALAIPALALPMSAQADVSANVGVANMYLWRGLNVSGSDAQVSGGLDYSHESGFYAGTWASSVWEGLGYELDLYLGFGGSVGDFSYDVSFWEYLYPTADVDSSLTDTDTSDFVISIGYDIFSAAAYIVADSDAVDGIYFTVGLDWGKFGVTYGIWTGDVTDISSEDGGLDYSHLTLSYNPVDTLTFKLSKAFAGDNADGFLEEDPLFQVSYTWNFDL